MDLINQVHILRGDGFVDSTTSAGKAVGRYGAIVVIVRQEVWP